MMTEAFGGVFVMMMLSYSLIPLFPFVYVLLRWRQAREAATPDPQLGLKVALYYFATIGLHVMLMATVAGIYGVLTDSPRASEGLLRAGLGLLLGGGIVYAIHRVLIARLTDPARRDNVARIFSGLNVVLCGLIGMGSLIAVAVMLVQESVPEDAFEVAISLMLVYLTTWAVQGRALVRMSAVA